MMDRGYQGCRGSCGNHGLDRKIGAEFHKLGVKRSRVDMPFPQLPAKILEITRHAGDPCGKLR
jgi:hypothetical protein